MSLAEVLAGAEPLENGLRLAVPEEWHQGRTAYGGFSGALALQAAMNVGGALPPLRSATVSFVGPLYGAVAVTARVLRRGKNATWVSAEITRDGEVGLVATFVFMGPVESRLHLNARPLPAGAIPVEDAPPLAFNPHSPAFLRNHFEARFAMPRSDAPQPELCWWVRLRDHAVLDPMQGLLLVADSLPPGVLPLFDRPVPVSSMNWQANLLTAAPQTKDGWWLLRSAGDYAENGCSSQDMSLWNTAGEPMMAGMQSIAMFG